MGFYFLKIGNLRFCLHAETNCYIIFYTEHNKLQERGACNGGKKCQMQRMHKDQGMELQ